MTTRGQASDMDAICISLERQERFIENVRLDIEQYLAQLDAARAEGSRCAHRGCDLVSCCCVLLAGSVTPKQEYGLCLPHFSALTRFVQRMTRFVDVFDAGEIEVAR